MILTKTAEYKLDQAKTILEVEGKKLLNCSQVIEILVDKFMERDKE